MGTIILDLTTRVLSLIRVSGNGSLRKVGRKWDKQGGLLSFPSLLPTPSARKTKHVEGQHHSLLKAFLNLLKISSDLEVLGLFFFNSAHLHELCIGGARLKSFPATPSAPACIFHKVPLGELADLNHFLSRFFSSSSFALLIY